MDNLFKLNNGLCLPPAAYGTYKAAENGHKAVLDAIKTGYRYFDTASFYGTEEYIADAIAESGIARENFQICTKLWKSEMGYNKAIAAFQASLKRLGTDYIDLYLIHWPLPEPGYDNWRELDIETWRALEYLYRQGFVKAIGVSNFLPHHLQNIMDNCDITPAIDQIEFHPGHTQEATVAYCRESGILVQAWSPLGRTRVLGDELICGLAEKYGCSPAQICIKYALQRGVMPIVKTTDAERMRQNMDLDAFTLSDEDMVRISSMPPCGWSGEHPDRKRVNINP